MAQLVKTIIYLYALSLETNDKTGQSVQIIHKIATDMINHNDEILKDFQLQWMPYDSALEQPIEPHQDMIHAMEIGSTYAQCLGNQTMITCPIVAGPTWTKSVDKTHDVFHLYDMLHIGSCSTHNALTEKPSFFRTITTDKDQANIILKLCDYFNWTEMGFVYLDPQKGYNDWLTEAVQESNSSIAIHPIYYKNTKKSMKKVAKFIYDKKLYVTVLYVRGDHLKDLFIELEELGIASYPYYYITADISWFDQGFIAKYNLTKYVNNLLGIIPGSPSMFNETIYKQMNDNEEDAVSIWKTSNELVYNITFEWNKLYETEKLMFPVDILNNYIYSAFDSIMAIALTLHEFFKKYSLFDIDAKTTQKIMRDILINNIKFNGSSGNVSFTQNGDRKNGILALVNVVDGIPMTVGGLFGDRFYIDENMIKWPSGFIEHGTVPQSNINIPVLYIVSFLFIISVIINAICGVYVIWSRIGHKNRSSKIKQEDSSSSSSVLSDDLSSQSFSKSHLDSTEINELIKKNNAENTTIDCNN